MNMRISFRGMDHSDSIENYAKKELELKVFKFLQKEPDPIYLDLVLSAGRTHAHHEVELRINSKHNHFIVKHEGPDLYVQIDHVIKIMAEEIKKQKSKDLDKRNHGEGDHFE